MPRQVFRAPLRSRLDSVDPRLATERAFRLGVCGLGGRLSVARARMTTRWRGLPRSTTSGPLAGLERFMVVPDGSVVSTGTRTACSARGCSPGRGATTPTRRRSPLISSTFGDCDWAVDPLPEHRVPPAVAATYRRGGRNFQRIRAAEGT